MIDLAPRVLWGQPVIVGAGIAGSVAALALSPHPAVLLEPNPTGLEAASHWAQGGLAAAVGPDDSAELHRRDTIAAGAGLTDPEVARRITAAGVDAVAMLEGWGVHFARGADGAFALGLEAAHSARRILHMRDATGAAMLAGLSAQVQQTPSITRLPATALRLVVEDGAIAGILLRMNGGAMLLPTRAVVLATGGVGALWCSTTNPAGAKGGGLVLAARAGAQLSDLEFVQFHPTALAVGADPMPLVSEAVRGEGAALISGDGVRFMEGTPGGDLAPRDVVARGVFRQWAGGGRAALDVRSWPAGKFAGRFPNIFNVLAGYGLDPARDPIPVRPAAHYHMGGVRVELTGRTSVAGLWACGEVACTWLHGANRLASNSLLEAVVCGRWAAEDIGGTALSGARQPRVADGEMRRAAAPDVVGAMRDIMDADVGVMRDAVGLSRAIEGLARLHRGANGTDAEDALAAALLIARAAERRRESRGGHWRADAAPQIDPPAHSVSSWSEMDTFDI